jgi:hypothetical protein
MYLLIAVALIILWIEYSFTYVPTYQEPIVNQTVPLAFPDQGKINLPPIVQPQNGPLQVQGPVRLGIAGNRYMDFSSGQNWSTLRFMDNGQQGQLISSGGSGQNDGNLQFNSRRLNINAPTSITGRLDAPQARFRSLKVYRTNEAWPNGWDPGIHTNDLYANATIAVGQNGGISASMNSSGVIRANTAYLNRIVSNDVNVGGRNLVAVINDLTDQVNQLKVNVNG